MFFLVRTIQEELIRQRIRGHIFRERRLRAAGRQIPIWMDMLFFDLLDQLHAAQGFGPAPPEPPALLAEWNVINERCLGRSDAESG